METLWHLFYSSRAPIFFGQIPELTIKMQLSITLLFLSGLSLSLAASRSRRAAYELPDGAELLVGNVKTSFACSNDGYYADIDNNCQIFHVCHTVVDADGKTEMQQWSFLCGNQTVFNQFSFTCASYEDAVPCGMSADFFNLNANLYAGPDVPFHKEDDVLRANAVTPGRPADGEPPVARPPTGGRPPARG